MVNDLSTLSRAERTDKEMEVETFSVHDILTELDTTYRPQAEKKSLRLVISADENLPMLTTSRLYIKEILQNFITNAIKYTPEGDVIVSAHVEAGNKLKLAVKDSGIGISKSEQDRVYDKFWRSEDPLTRQTNGTGLGLYITAKLARRIGGQLDLESAPKQGSTFSITLPALAVQDVDKKNVVKNEVENILD
jgi:signal transduction histidine kinase